MDITSDYSEKVKTAVTDRGTEQLVHQACNTFDFGSIFINMLYFNWVISLPVWKRGCKDILKSSCLVKNMASVSKGKKCVYHR